MLRNDSPSPEPRSATPAVESEFGVPFPGRVEPRERWTQTALKEWPGPGPLAWADLFGRTAPQVVDLGCGNGRFLIASALARPDHDHLGLDALPVVLRYATRRANQRGLANVRFAVGDGTEFLAERVTPHSLAELHIYHPQPYDEPGQGGRRLITPRFLALAWRALVPGGLLVLQTDHPGYWRYCQEVVPRFFEFTVLERSWPDAPHGRTRREILARQRGLPVFRGLGRPRGELDEREVEALAASLPRSEFGIDHRVRRLDREEKAGAK